MNYAAIKNCDIANGPGVRVSLFSPAAATTARIASIPKRGTLPAASRLMRL